MDGSLLIWIIIFSAAGSIGAVGGAALFLAFPSGIRGILVPCLISYATGTLLGAAFLGMIPHALNNTRTNLVSGTVLGGIILFFLLEKLVLWRHCHGKECTVHAAGPLILLGDAFHNFIDGVVIAAAFLSSIPLGVTTALAVVAHEVPQEVGDFGILLDSGYKKSKALTYNLISSISTLPGAIIGYFYLESAEQAIPYILSLSAASFIYIAMADLIPTLHRKPGLGASIRQFILLLAGVGTILLFQH